jgi:hypothetical protein
MIRLMWGSLHLAVSSSGNWCHVFNECVASLTASPHNRSPTARKVAIFPCNCGPVTPLSEIVNPALTVESGQIVAGPLFNEPMRVKNVHGNGNDTWVLGFVGVRSERFRRVTIKPANV